MNVSEIRGKTNHELGFELETLKKQLFEMRFKSKSSNLPNPSRIAELRREIARVHTVLKERALGVRGQQAS
jgi:large subunit ribosomal protein L29